MFLNALQHLEIVFIALLKAMSFISSLKKRYGHGRPIAGAGSAPAPGLRLDSRTKEASSGPKLSFFLVIGASFPGFALGH